MLSPIPANESDRLAALEEYEILDTQAEKVFDDLTRLASYICKTPIALITLLDSDRQWFKSKIGITQNETSRDVAFCAHAIMQTDTFIVPNALADERFRDNPLVTGETGLRFYAGSPLTTSDGYKLGTLCVIDKIARDLSDGQLAGLRALSFQVTTQLELRREIARLKKALASTGERT
jgi:hypothetical protein